MKIKELIDYFKQFPEDAELSMIIANTSKREVYPVHGVTGIVDSDVPVFLVEVGKPKCLDETGGTEHQGVMTE